MKAARTFLLVAASLLAFGSARTFAQLNTQTYNGNGGGSFGGSIGQGSLTLSTDGTTLNGTITLGPNNAYNDELVIYIDSQTGGFNNTSTFTDTGNGGDTLRKATSATNGTNTAPLTFAPGFYADYAIALSPAKAHYGSLYTLASNSSFTFDGSANLSPTYSNNGTSGNGIFTFSIPLSAIGSPTAFTFQTTYLNGNDAYRSNEAFGNTIVDTTTPTNTGSLAQDGGMLVGLNTFSTVPEPATWLAGSLLCGLFCWRLCVRRGLCC